MITKIIEIRNLGIIASCKPLNLPDFKNVNIIYGYNGSGKTTLSKLFSSLPSGSSKEFPELAYKLIVDGAVVSQKQSLPIRIRIFNQDFINENLDMINCKASPIFIIGKGNVVLNELIKSDEMLLEGDGETRTIGKKRELENFRQQLSGFSLDRAKLFTDVAREIYRSMQGAASRNYNKANAEKDFRELPKMERLDNLVLTSKLAIISGTPGYKLEKINEVPTDEEFLQNLELVDQLLGETVSNRTLEKLVKNPDLSHWVETGLLFHQKDDSEICEFCGNHLTKTRIDELLGHFNEQDKQLKTAISLVAKYFNELKTNILNIVPESEAKVYINFRDEYVNNVASFQQEKDILVNQINELLEELDLKKKKTTESVIRKTSVDLNKFFLVVESLNNSINKNNEMTESYAELQEEARLDVKNHCLSEIAENVTALDREINIIEKRIQILIYGDGLADGFVGINKLVERISVNKQKISSSGPACEELNLSLTTFLGRDELYFKHTEEGYELLRYGFPARNLSEGEKTAIAFVYFTIQIKDKDFDPNRGIVVIDDPVSSLDSNSLFQAFSFLKTNMEGIHQVFILTHNFDFLKLVQNWRSYYKKNLTEYFMIRNEETNGKRHAIIDSLDRMLTDFQTEYQYLFKKLYTFKSDGTLKQVYSCPNEARKLLESFLAIAIPTIDGPYAKLKYIHGFSEEKKSHIYKFTNDQSHITGKGFDLSLVHETPVVIHEIMELMQFVLPDHFNYLVTTVQR